MFLVLRSGVFIFVNQAFLLITLEKTLSDLSMFNPNIATLVSINRDYRKKEDQTNDGLLR